MSLRSIIYQFSRKFSKSKMDVLLVQDCPPLGFEGQVIRVKPGFANLTLFPKKMAIYNFPGTKERLYPNFSEEIIEKKKIDYQMKLFEKKLDGVQVEISRTYSSINQNALKDPLKVKDIIDAVRDQTGMELVPSNVRLADEIYKYGQYRVDIDEYYSEKYKRKFNFRIQLVVNKVEPKIDKRLEVLKQDTAKAK